MNESSHIRINTAGEVYNNGRAFTKAKWYKIVIAYKKILSKKGRCTVRMLAAGAKISLTSANKAIIYYDIGVVIPPISQRGNCKRGVGSLCGLQMEHHIYIYKL